MFEILVSLFGLVVIARILSQLKNFSIISTTKSTLLLIIFQLPFYFLVIFKEQRVFYIIYIGSFFISLIFFRQILSIFAEKTFRRHQLHVLDQLIMSLKAGKSAAAGVKRVINRMNEWEKMVFKPLLFCFDVKNHEIKVLCHAHKGYFNEIISILHSNSKIIDQLTSLRDGLKIEVNLRRKSSEVTQQLKAQALVAIGLYVGMFFISWNFLGLEKHSGIIFLSLVLFFLGEALVFVMGGKIKWKT